MLPPREGRFKASIVEHGVAETGPNNLATFICEFRLLEELAGDEWIPVDEDFQITGYFYLEKRDGTLNAITIDQLKQAFDWDGRDPFYLQDTDFAGGGHHVQVKLAIEEYAGKTRLKVQYVNPVDWSGNAVPTADDVMRRSISHRLGAKFRANAGVAKTPAARTKANANTKNHATAQTPNKSQANREKRRPGAHEGETSSTGGTTASRPQATATMEQAWEAFANSCPGGWTRQNVEDEWFSVIGQLFPGQQVDQLKPEDWARVRDDGPRLVVPI